MKILLYEDEFSDIENVLFINRMKIEIPGRRLYKVGSFQVFQNIVNRETFDAIILDVMGAETNIKNFNDKRRVSSQYIGIEMLARLRGGYYKRQDPELPVIMRTARANEFKIRRLCLELGTEHIFLPGKEDHEVIELLKQLENGLKEAS